LIPTESMGYLETNMTAHEDRVAKLDGKNVEIFQKYSRALSEKEKEALSKAHQVYKKYCKT
jgi:predicted nucleotidyltransferase